MASTKFTYDVGYMGVVAIADASTSVNVANGIGAATQILATGGNINVQQTPIFSSGVWGAGWYNAAQQVAYAPNFITLTGSVNYQLTRGNSFDILQKFAFTDRANSKGYVVYILPNGMAGYGGHSWCESMSFSASQDALVTGDVGFKSGDVESGVYTPGVLVDSSSSNDTQFDIDYQSQQSKFGASGGDLAIDEQGNVTGVGMRKSFGLLNVYPFWATGVKVNAEALKLDGEEKIEQVDKLDASTPLPDVMDWNASYSSQVVLAKLCSGASVERTYDSIQADYAALGTMSADGSFTMFGVNKQLNPKKIRQCRKCVIVMGDAANPNIQDEIRFGSVIFQSGSTDIQTGSSFTQTSFNFTALGNGKEPVMSLWKNPASTDSTE